MKSTKPKIQDSHSRFPLTLRLRLTGKIPNSKFFLKKSAGSTLLFALMVSTIVMVSSLAVAQLLVTELNVGLNVQNSQSAYNVLQSGIEDVLLKRKIGTAGSGTVCLDSPINSLCYRYENNTSNNSIVTKGRTSGVERLFGFSVCSISTPSLGIGAGDWYSFSLKPGGRVWAAGYNDQGQLGLGSLQQYFYSWTSSSLTDITAIDGGIWHSTALKSDGTVWETGRVWEFGFQTDWVQTYANSDITAISNGGGSRILALKSDGTVLERSAGSGAWGPSSINNVVAISTGSGGDAHFLALKSDGKVWVKGYNEWGQLGLGDKNSIGSWIQAPLLGNNNIAISAGYGHSLALKSNGEVWGAGYNGNGELGTQNPSTQPSWTKTPGISNVTVISAGNGHSLALKPDGTVWATGSNFSGQLGIGGSEPRYYSWNPSSLSNIIAISGGGYHSLALKSDGTVWVTGYNNRGQLGLDSSVTQINTWRQNCF